MSNNETPDLIQGSIKLWIKMRVGRRPEQGEVEKLAKEWESKYSRMGLKDFMIMKGYKQVIGNS